MDNPYFPPAPQAYHFIGLPPTPTHTGTNSKDFSNSPLVQEVFQSSHPYTQSILSPKQDAFEFQSFDGFHVPFSNHNQCHTRMPRKPPTPVLQHKGSVNYELHLDMMDGDIKKGSNSDDDENMTPAQSRRKVQNRAAQRAFRERKERHVKDLEAKLATLEKNSQSVVQENERLKLQLQKAATENEILKAKSKQSSRSSSDAVQPAGPFRHLPMNFYTSVLHAHENKTSIHRIITSDTGERLLAADATWDYIIQHPLYVRGLVDVGLVSERLKTQARCNGQGPAFEERAIIEAIERSVASGTDELL